MPDITVVTVPALVTIPQWAIERYDAAVEPLTDTARAQLARDVERALGLERIGFEPLA